MLLNSFEGFQFYQNGSPLAVVSQVATINDVASCTIRQPVSISNSDIVILQCRNITDGQSVTVVYGTIIFEE